MTLAEHLERTNFRGPGFDRIRLFAALIVVLHHCSFYSMSNIADDFLSSATGGTLDFGRLAVNIFFVTSGILVAPGLLRSGDLVSFAINRALRVMPALIVVVSTSALVIGPILTTLSASDYYSDPQAYLYLKNIAFRTARYLPGVEANGTPIIVNGALWTIYFEVLSYGVLAVMFLTGVTRRPALLLASFAVTYAVFAYSQAMRENPWHVPETLLVFSQLFVYFLAGVIISALSAIVPYSGKIAIFFVLLCLLSFPLEIAYFSFPILLSYIVAYVGYSNLLGGKGLKIDLSYGVYLMHSVVITFLIVSVPQVDSFLMGSAVVIAATLCLAFLSWTFLEEPCLRRKKLARDLMHRFLARFWIGRWLSPGPRGNL